MEEISFSHVSVLLAECIDALNIRDGYTYVDATAGGGGHSLEIAKRLGKNSRLICFDRDKDAIKAAKARLKDYLDRVTFINDNFSCIEGVIKELNITNLGGVLADLGCSSYQFDTAERGFSYMHDAALDMRMDTDAPLSAYNVVNEYPECELKRIIYEYGEERFAPRIAEAIVRQRAISEIKTTSELASIIKGASPAATRQDGPHPAKRTFQAIRIEVNGELNGLDTVIEDIIGRLNSKGRLCIITFHSLEDRIVKRAFALHSTDCICDKKLPICICGHKASVKSLGKIKPTKEELDNNSRSASATLRIIEKL